MERRNPSKAYSPSCSREMNFLRCLVTATKVCADGDPVSGGSQTLFNVEQRGMGYTERVASGIYML